MEFNYQLISIILFQLQLLQNWAQIDPHFRHFHHLDEIAVLDYSAFVVTSMVTIANFIVEFINYEPINFILVRPYFGFVTTMKVFELVTTVTIITATEQSACSTS